MRFNYLGQMEKYAVLKTVVEEAGYRVMPFPAFQAGDAIGFIFPVEASPPAVLLVYRREPGWFIRIPGSQIYHVHKGEQIAEVCLALLSYAKHNSALPTIDTPFMQAFDWVAFPLEEWIQFEWKQQRIAWEKKGWHELNPREEEVAWDLFRRRFGINGTEEPVSSCTWDIGSIFQGEESAFQELETDLTLKTLTVLRHCTTPGKRLYALASNHPCYYFDPHGNITDAYRDSWAVPVLPNGDNYCFFDCDFQFGILARHNDHTICVFGQQLLDAFETNKPLLFHKLIRINGKAIEARKEERKGGREKGTRMVCRITK